MWPSPPSGYDVTFDHAIAGNMEADNIVVFAGKPCSGGTIAGGSTGQAVNDIVTLAPTGGTPAGYLVVEITAVSGGAATSFSIISGGFSTTNPTSYSQINTTGVGVGLSITSPTFGASTTRALITLDSSAGGGGTYGFGSLGIWNFDDQGVLNTTYTVTVDGLTLPPTVGSQPNDGTFLSDAFAYDLGDHSLQAIMTQVAANPGDSPTDALITFTFAFPTSVSCVPTATTIACTWSSILPGPTLTPQNLTASLLSLGWRVGSSGMFTLAQGITGTSYTISGLTPATTYQVVLLYQYLDGTLVFINEHTIATGVAVGGFAQIIG